MSILRLTASALLIFATISLIACSESAVKRMDSANQGGISQTDIDLMIHKAKAAERVRVQAEYKQQVVRASVFAHLKKMKLPALAGSCLVRVTVPAQTLSSDTKVQISEQRESYRAAICKKYFTVENIIKVQASLHDKGYLTSKKVTRSNLLNGLWDDRTQRAMLTYQKENGLAYGVEEVEWTLESMKSLNLL